MSLTFFTAIADFTAVITRSSLQPDPNPFLQAMTGLVTFTPSTTSVWSEADETYYELTPIQGRIDHGALTDIPRRPNNPDIPAENPGERPDHRRYGVRLVANTDALGPLPTLDYKVSFSKVVFNKRDQRLPTFTFPAPNDDTPIDLALVHHRTRR